MTAALLRWWTVPRLKSHSNPSSTGESSTAKKPTNIHHYSYCKHATLRLLNTPPSFLATEILS